MTATRIDLAGLTTHVVGPADAKLTCLLMHGFSAPGDNLVPFAGAFDLPVRFVFPEAPIDLGGLYDDSRAWWMLDLAQFERDLASGVPSDRRGDHPEGLVAARDHVNRLIDQLQIAPDQLVLGGFSQGAMLALDVALHREAPPAGLVLMSGTLIAESELAPRMPKLAGVPVMLSHGRQDGVLPYWVAEILRDQLTAAGAIVDWQPFRGGHETPMAVVAAIGQLLRGLL